MNSGPTWELHDSANFRIVGKYGSIASAARLKRADINQCVFGAAIA